MNCPRCSAFFPDIAKFCHECGTTIIAQDLATLFGETIADKRKGK